MKIPGSVAIVTGASRGFGRAFSEELLKRGGKVCLADVNETEGWQTERTFKQKYGDETSLFVKCDVTSETDIQALWRQALEKFKTVDLVVNNAGILDERQIEKTLDINLLGAMRGSMAAFEFMRRDKGGKGGVIINVASTAGLFPVFFMPAYAASKYGLVGFTRSWAMNPSQATYGVNFACLCPSFSETSMLNDTVKVTDPPLCTYSDNKAQTHAIIDKLGINPVDEVAAVFIDLVQKDDNNGAVLSLDKAYGPVYRYTKHPHKL